MRVEILGDERRRRWGDERKLEIVLRHRLLEVADRCGLVLGLIVQVRVAGIIPLLFQLCGRNHFVDDLDLAQVRGSLGIEILGGDDRRIVEAGQDEFQNVLVECLAAAV